MTKFSKKEDLAKSYHERIIEQNSQEKAKAYCQPILIDNHNKTYGFELYDIDMKTKRLYEDKKIVLEQYDNGNYRATFFNDDNHWDGDIIFNDKVGVIHDDVKEDDVKINECIEYTQNKIKAVFCNTKCGANRPCEKYDYKNHLCEDFCKFETLLKL